MGLSRGIRVTAHITMTEHLSCGATSLGLIRQSVTLHLAQFQTDRCQHSTEFFNTKCSDESISIIKNVLMRVYPLLKMF